MAVEERIKLLTRASNGCADTLKKRQGPGRSDFVKFDSKLSEPSTKYVATGDEQFQSFEKGPITMGADGFDGCIGIVLSSPKGGIIAHYTSTKDGTEKGKKSLTDLIKKHKDSFRSDETVAFVFANVLAEDHSKFINKDQKDVFVKLVKDEVGVDAKIEKYLSADLIDISDIDIGDAELVDEKLDKLKGKPKGGAILLRNEGKGTPSVVTFVDVKLQTAGDSCPV